MAKKVNDEPEVTVFGEVVTEKKKRSRHDSDAASGIFFIFIGIVLLLNSLEILPWEIWGEIVRFWPLLLIMAGIKILLGRNIVSRMLIIIINLLIFGSLLLFLLIQYSPELVAWLPNEARSYINYWKLIHP